MEELGADAKAYHRRLGRSLPLRDCDQLFVIGTHAHDVCAGVLDQDDFTHQISMVAALEPVAEIVATWRGSIFIKGSRRYQLEKVLVHQSILELPC
jgi:UDP-N-acetylmuramoyl-tripeptide--D-alanyl-D-alanine ligase